MAAMTDAAHPTARIAIVGPVSWNQIVYLDELPAPVPHMQFALDSFETVGGTSAGKALHLASLDRIVSLDTVLGADAAGEQLRAALDSIQGIELNASVGTVTERHLNLMTHAGERVSIYLATPAALTDPARAAATIESCRLANVIVLDLSMQSRDLIPQVVALGIPVWADLHDYDGSSEFHQPFVDAADVVFMNADKTEDPWLLLGHCVDRGAQLAVCTLGAAGAIALDTHGVQYRVAAEPADVVDTNGAGDAFMAGFLDAYLRGEDTALCLRAAARQATVALSSKHLHPILAGTTPESAPVPVLA